jgi:hypothetical protein
MEGTSTPTDIISNGSILNTNTLYQTQGGQSFGAFIEGSTHVSSDSTHHPSDSIHDINNNNNNNTIDKNEREASALFLFNLQKKKPNNSKENIKLTETPTFQLLNIPAIRLCDTDTNLEVVKEANKRYIQVSQKENVYLI